MFATVPLMGGYEHDIYEISVSEDQQASQMSVYVKSSEDKA